MYSTKRQELSVNFSVSVFKSAIAKCIEYTNPNTDFWTEVITCASNGKAKLHQFQRGHLHEWCINNKFYLVEGLSPRKKLKFNHKLDQLLPK